MIDGGEWSSKRSGSVVFVYKRRNAGLPTANPTCRTEKPVALSSSVYVIGQARSSDVLTNCKFHLPSPVDLRAYCLYKNYAAMGRSMQRTCGRIGYGRLARMVSMPSLPDENVSDGGAEFHLRVQGQILMRRYTL